MPVSIGMVMTTRRETRKKPIIHQPIHQQNQSKSQVNYKPHMKMNTSLSMNNRYTMSGMYNSSNFSYG
jgi:hypothetical protein